MGKRGQVYILAALLLAVAIYSLSTIVNVVQQEEIKGDFKSLAANYETESSKLINSVLQSGGNVSDSFNNFTYFFTSYSKAKSPNFHIFYALAYGGDVYFGNFMDESLKIYVPCPAGDCPLNLKKELPGCLGKVSAQISFDGLTIKPEYFPTTGEFDAFRGDCFWSYKIGSGPSDYCADVGGVMYNLSLSIKENVPTIFSLSRLKSGAQTLYSIHGEVGQEQTCKSRTESLCTGCKEVCCWKDGKCEENRCSCGTEDYECPAFTCCEGYKCDSGKCAVCTESWSCGSWGSCVGGQQTRTCTDANNCGTTVNKPATTQGCVCQEIWACTAWGACDCTSHKQTRTCTDANNCGTTVNKPATTRGCTCKKLTCAYTYSKRYYDCLYKESANCGNNRCSPDTCLSVVKWTGSDCGRRKDKYDWNCKKYYTTGCSESPSCPGGYSQEGGAINC